MVDDSRYWKHLGNAHAPSPLLPTHTILLAVPSGYCVSVWQVVNYHLQTAATAAGYAAFVAHISFLVRFAAPDRDGLTGRAPALRAADHVFEPWWLPKLSKSVFVLFFVLKNPKEVFKSYQVLLFPLLSCPALSYPALPCPALPCPAVPCLALLCRALPCFAQSSPSLLNLAQPGSALSSLAQSCLALPFLALPCQALPSPALLCRAVPLFRFALPSLAHLCSALPSLVQPCPALHSIALLCIFLALFYISPALHS